MGGAGRGRASRGRESANSGAQGREERPRRHLRRLLRAQALGGQTAFDEERAEEKCRQ